MYCRYKVTSNPTHIENIESCENTELRGRCVVKNKDVTLSTKYETFNR